MKNFFATLCVLVVVVLFPFVLLGTVIQTRVLTTPALKALVRTSDIGGQLPDLIVAKMQESMEREQQSSNGEENNGSGPSAEEVAQKKEEIAKALPPETVNGLFDQVIDAGAIWWKNDAALEVFPLVLNIAPYKDAVKPLLQDTELVTNDDGTLPDTIDLQSILTTEAQNKPDDFTKYNEQITQARNTSRQVRLFIIIGWVVIVLSLLGIVLLVREPKERVAKWFGWTGVVLLLESAVLLVAAYLLPGVIESIALSNGVPAEAKVALSVFTSVGVVLWHALAIVTAGVSLLVIAAFGVEMKLRRR